MKHLSLIALALLAGCDTTSTLPSNNIYIDPLYGCEYIVVGTFDEGPTSITPRLTASGEHAGCLPLDYVAPFEDEL